MRRARIVIVLAALSTAVALAAARAARTDSPALTAVTGANDSYVISVQDSSGNSITHLGPGTYTINVSDRSAIHNFHLVGPGVDKATSVLGTGDFSWPVTLVDGYYRYLCDPHVTAMHGDVIVGNGRRPLTAFVGPGKALSLRDAFSIKVTEIAPSRVVLTVRDRSKTSNFRLRGPGVNKATGIAFRGTVRWTLTLKAGTYTYSSDSHKSVRHSLRVTGPPTWGT